ncbi:DUF4907 domain-containing protein [Formosa haliotis]|uniref:DUF4907 domain-containing protein n=1 Tax=Formosa haliotis TaxID=1555194 RepID=UPI000824F05A|nr:DUF4907 domain-containing protein [Formosa haliotis]
MKKAILIVLVLSIVSAVGVLFFSLKNEKISKYKANIYTVNSGYGYNISKDNKIVIKQEVIPAVQNNLTFCSESDAKTIANLVIEKLEHKTNPNITIKELESNSIALNCNN